MRPPPRPGSGSRRVRLDRATASCTSARTRPTTHPCCWPASSRGRQEVLPGVDVSTSADWFLPGGQGGDIVVAAALEQHRQWLQHRSSLAPLGAVFGSSGRELPSPDPAPQSGLARRGAAAGPGARPRPFLTPGTGWCCEPTSPRTWSPTASTGTACSPISVTGTWAGQPVTGAASWRRAASGEVEQVTVAVVAARTLVKGEPALPKGRRRSRTSRSRSPPPVNGGWSRAG